MNNSENKKYKLIVTNDGSHTIYHRQFKETYHSIFGAIQESMHIYLTNGFHCIAAEEIHIFEVGFGTGLNCFLTYLEAEKFNKKVFYHCIDIAPLCSVLLTSLNYSSILSPDKNEIFISMHKHSCWEKEQNLSEKFTLLQSKKSILDIQLKPNRYNLVYFDVFSPNIQPEVWSELVFRKLYQSMKVNAILLTYSSKGLIKRNLKKSGFNISRIKGPFGKNHILRAQKLAEKI